MCLLVVLPCTNSYSRKCRQSFANALCYSYWRSVPCVLGTLSLQRDVCCLTGLLFQVLRLHCGLGESLRPSSQAPHGLRGQEGTTNPTTTPGRPAAQTLAPACQESIQKIGRSYGASDLARVRIMWQTGPITSHI